MSQRKSKTGVPHLVYQANTGFQYYLTFPKHYALNPKLPAQIRWSLGHDEALARALAEYLNPRLQQIIAKTNKPKPELAPELAAVEVAALHDEVQRFLRDSRQSWRNRPFPAALAKQDPKPGYLRLIKECNEHPVLFREHPGGEIYFSLAPSEQLMQVLKIRFARFDWPLGTSDEKAANDAAVFIYNAIIALETIPFSKNGAHVEGPFHAAMCLYEYLCFARPDKGRNLLHIPPSLPQSAQSASFHSGQQHIDRGLKFCGRFLLIQKESGLYAIRVSLDQLEKTNRKSSESLEIELLTSSPIIAKLLVHFGLLSIDRIIEQCFIEASTDDPCEQAMREINDLIRRMLGPVQPAEPMHSFPQGEASEPLPAPDPGTAALLSALNSVLAPEQQARLSAIFEAPAANNCIVAPAPAAGLRLSELISEFEERQVREGAWSNPRTRITAHARLEGLAELLGAHRRVDSLTRTEFNQLRDLLRSYPKNRHRLRATRYQPLSKIIQDGRYEPINARTAKKFFELARSLIKYAHDQGYVKENAAAGLTFSTKGCASPRKRTYSHRQIGQLLNGPTYTLTDPPRWRLDDYRFWLPLLGLYSGARLSELCQLRLGDIREELGVWVFSINQSGTKQLKTADSERLVPLHKVVLEAGFLAFHQLRLKATANDLLAPLFENLRVYGDLSPGHIASRWFLGSGQGKKGYLGLCGLGDDDLTFHGLRHTFINQFRRQKLDLLIGKALVGHADKSTTGGYGDCYPAYVLKAELDKIDFETPVSHIRHENYQLLKVRQGAFSIGRPVGSKPIEIPRDKRYWKSYVQ